MNKFLLSLLILLVAKNINAQNLEKALATYTSQNNWEKVYFHFDKEQYAPGETIWFKAYIFNLGYPSTTSNNFYVQLLNRDGDLIDKKVYPISGAAVIGNIELSDSLLSGTYVVRAGTYGMLHHHNQAAVYHKKLTISPSNRALPVSTEVPAEIKFFPESGNLIDGILTVVTFKATDVNGIPVETKGMLITPEGMNIPFKTSGNGMGRIQFRPKVDKVYYAEVEAGGKVVKFDLPAVNPAGVNLKVQDEKRGKMFQLSKVEKIKNEYETVTLVAQINNKVVYDNTISFDNYPSVKGHLITDSLPSGILQFTVFNSKMEPIAERLTFVDNKEYTVPATLHIEKKDLNKRGENVIRINFPDTLPKSLSVSVSDGSVPIPYTQDNIYSYFILSSHLSHPLNNAANFFKIESDSLRLVMDNFLITETMSRMQWSQVLSLANSNPAKRPVDPYLITINGVAVEEKDNAPVNGGQLNIFLEDIDSSVKSFSIPVSASGKFVIDSLLFYGEGKFYYTYLNASGKGKAISIKVDENPLHKNLQRVPESWKQHVVFSPMDLMDDKSRMKQTVFNENKSSTLENVIIQSAEKRTSETVNDKYTTGLFKNSGKIVLDNINFPVNNETLNVIAYLEQNLRTVKFQGGRFVNLKNFSMRNGQNWEVGLLLNETPVNASTLTPINMNEVALIKFYEAGFPGVSSNLSPGGAIAIYTKKNEEKKNKVSEKFFTYPGYSVVKEYHQVQSTTPAAGLDNRTTLYWNPLVFPKQSYTFSFLNNDISKKIKVIVQGFDALGRFIHIEKMIE